MNDLPEFDLVISEDGQLASESFMVAKLMAKLGSSVSANPDADSAVSNILSSAFASVGFGPIAAVLRDYAS